MTHQNSNPASIETVYQEVFIVSIVWFALNANTNRNHTWRSIGGEKQVSSIVKLDDSYSSFLVSKGTLFVDDLVCECMRFIQTEELDPVLTELIVSIEGKLKDSAYRDKKARPDHREKILLEDIFPLLEEIAPVGHFFGIHPGDPGRVGFWEDGLHFHGSGP
jgi:hypothetical protein